MIKDIVYFAKVKPNAIIPSKREEDAAWDIYSCFEEEYIALNPHETKMLPSGIASACSSDYYFQLFERGSTGTKGMGQRCGVIDSGFRNEWFVPITNHNDFPIVVVKENTDKEILKRRYGNRTAFYPYEKAICQAVLLPVPKVTVNEVDYETLKNFTSERGLGCLGSSGK